MPVNALDGHWALLVEDTRGSRCELTREDTYGREKTNSSSEENSTTAINQTEDKEGVLGGLLKGLKKIREFGGKKVGESG